MPVMGTKRHLPSFQNQSAESLNGKSHTIQYTTDKVIYKYSESKVSFTIF